jgi:hypothetical protein
LGNFYPLAVPVLILPYVHRENPCDGLNEIESLQLSLLCAPDAHAGRSGSPLRFDLRSVLCADLPVISVRFFRAISLCALKNPAKM